MLAFIVSISSTTARTYGKAGLAYPGLISQTNLQESASAPLRSACFAGAWMQPRTTEAPVQVGSSLLGTVVAAFGKLNRIRLRDALPYSHPYPPCHRWLNSLLAIVMARLNSLLAIVLATYTIVLGRVNRSGMPTSSPAVRRLLQLMLLLLLASSVSATSPGTTTVNDTSWSLLDCLLASLVSANGLVAPLPQWLRYAQVMPSSGARQQPSWVAPPCY